MHFYPVAIFRSLPLPLCIQNGVITWWLIIILVLEVSLTSNILALLILTLALDDFSHAVGGVGVKDRPLPRVKVVCLRLNQQFSNQFLGHIMYCTKLTWLHKCFCKPKHSDLQRSLPAGFRSSWQETGNIREVSFCHISASHVNGSFNLSLSRKICPLHLCNEPLLWS